MIARIYSTADCFSSDAQARNDGGDAKRCKMQSHRAQEHRQARLG